MQQNAAGRLAAEGASGAGREQVEESAARRPEEEADYLTHPTFCFDPFELKHTSRFFQFS
jgi:hypothetical protein